MTPINLSLLSAGTVFTYEGKEFRKTTLEWYQPYEQALKPGQSFHESVKSTGKGRRESVVGCEPKFGGVFQSRLCVFIPFSAEVTVE